MLFLCHTFFKLRSRPMLILDGDLMEGIPLIGMPVEIRSNGERLAVTAINGISFVRRAKAETLALAFYDERLIREVDWKRLLENGLVEVVDA